MCSILTFNLLLLMHPAASACATIWFHLRPTEEITSHLAGTCTNTHQWNVHFLCNLHLPALWLYLDIYIYLLLLFYTLHLIYFSCNCVFDLALQVSLSMRIFAHLNCPNWFGLLFRKLSLCTHMGPSGWKTSMLKSLAWQWILAMTTPAAGIRCGAA